MRPHCLSLIGLLLGTAVFAQQPQPVQPVKSPAAPNAARLDQLLQRWEQEMKNVQTLTAEMVHKDLDKTRGSTTEFVGTAKYMKPNFALLEMAKKGNPNVYEKFLATGTFMYAWVPSSKVVRVYELSGAKPGQVGDDNFLSFLFGMKAEEAKRRYEMKLVKEDQWYVYLEVLPRFPADKADFAKARLVLNQSNFLPRQLWFEQPNGNEITWDIPKIATGVNLPREAFQPPSNLPPGWNLVRVPRADMNGTQRPRIIRQQDREKKRTKRAAPVRERSLTVAAPRIGSSTYKRITESPITIPSAARRRMSVSVNRMETLPPREAVTMTKLSRLGLFLSAAWLLDAPASLQAQSREIAILEKANMALGSVAAMQTHLNWLPANRVIMAQLRKAQGVAIFPDMFKAAAGIGHRHGCGVLLIRQADDSWGPPLFLKLSGASAGIQLGIERADLVVAFRTRSDLERLKERKLILGVDNMLAVGSWGVEHVFGIDARLKTCILSPSSPCRGFCAGWSVEENRLQIDAAATYAYEQYEQNCSQKNGSTGTGKPSPALRLQMKLAELSVALPETHAVAPPPPIIKQTK